MEFSKFATTSYERLVDLFGQPTVAPDVPVVWNFDTPSGKGMVTTFNSNDVGTGASTSWRCGADTYAGLTWILTQIYGHAPADLG